MGSTEDGRLRVGVEVGGTFTDLVAIRDGSAHVYKVPSTPKNPAEGALNALVQGGVDLADLADLAHGSTVATNAVLERKGFKTAFITTAGFRDILFLQRHNRTRIYDLEYEKPRPIVFRRDTFEINERIDAGGSVIVPLNIEQARAQLVPAIREGGYAAVAICLLNGYVNPLHEHRLAEMLGAALPGLLVTASHRVTREFREYERASTTVLSAYIQPVVDTYLAQLERELSQRGFTGRLSVMQSNGGRLPVEGVRRNAITALLSGPAAGVIGAVRQAQRSGVNDLITLDMGGTSTDICLVQKGVPGLTSEFEIDGLPVRTPVVEISTIGAGGGSIVWIDEGGMLRVGPQSAGADPGPVCYGRGGTRPTITDAHMIRGAIRAEGFLGGRMSIDLEGAHQSFSEIARQLNMSVEEAADSAVQVANANIVRAIQLISTERGKDPRDYVMVPFGGAGPLHAAQVAEQLGIPTIVVPPNAGVISAFGLLASDYVLFDSLTRRMLLDVQTPSLVRDIYEEMSKATATRFKEMRVSGELRVEFIADMRFVGQAFEVAVNIPVERINALSASELRNWFLDAHKRIYHHSGSADQSVELVSFRIKAVAELAVPTILSESQGQVHQPENIQLFQDRLRHDGLMIARGSMSVSDAPVIGPALVGDPTSTIFIPKEWQAQIDESSNLIMRRRG